MDLRNVAITHQILCITEVDFVKETIHGYTELTIVPLTNDDIIHMINLNCKQCKIHKIIFNGQYEANFEYCDPTLMIIPENDEKRDLQTFLNQQELSVLSVESDEGNGEITITIPKECQQLLKEQNFLKLAVEYSLEKPKGGIRFLNENNHQLKNNNNNNNNNNGYYNSENNDFEGYYLFTCDHHPNLWFPCVNSTNEPCTWKIEVTVNKLYNVITSGDIIEKILNNDQQTITYHYYLSIPTCPSNIGLCIGKFDMLVDDNMNEITNYCLPNLIQLLKHTTSFIHEVFEYYEDHLSTQYPYSSYKQIFINDVNDTFLSYATMTIFNVNLLHPSSIIEQTFISRKILSIAVAKQFFGCFLVNTTFNDWWLVSGLRLYISSLYYKKSFGNNEYRYMLYQDLKQVCTFERENCNILLDMKSIDSKETKYHYSIKHLTIVYPLYMKVAEKKAHLVVRLIEDAIGSEIMIQMLNKLLALASNAANQKYTKNCWNNLMISVDSFLRLLSTVSAKDIKPLLDQWVHKSGVARFNCSFTFNRKRNIVELELKQDMFNQKGYRKYIGPLTIVIQELDGPFTHTLQLEENQTKYDITCHSKARRNKKKKILLFTGDEVDMEIGQIDSDSPVLWIRIDPDMKILREIKFEQPDYHWQYLLKYERDIGAQLDAVETLVRFHTIATRNALASVVENSDLYYQIRINAAYALAEVANKMVHTWNGPLPLISSYKNMFMSRSCPTIVRINNYNDLQQYYLQKHLPIAMANLRNIHNVCPNEVIKFILELIKYNENSKNRFSDCYYKASLIDALSATISSTTIADDIKSSNLSNELRLVIEEICLRLNLEKLTATYRYVVTCSCLKALRNLQKLGHIPENVEIFKQYTQYGTFEDVRKIAFEIIVKFFEVRSDYNLMKYIIDYIKNDPSNIVKNYIIELLIKSPPFKPTSDISILNSNDLVDGLWKLINETNYDYRLKSNLVELYQTLYGFKKPKCTIITAKQSTSKETIKFNDPIQPLKI